MRSELDYQSDDGPQSHIKQSVESGDEVVNKPDEEVVNKPDEEVVEVEKDSSVEMKDIFGNVALHTIMVSVAKGISPRLRRLVESIEPDTFDTFKATQLNIIFAQEKEWMKDRRDGSSDRFFTLDEKHVLQDLIVAELLTTLSTLDRSGEKRQMIIQSMMEDPSVNFTEDEAQELQELNDKVKVAELSFWPDQRATSRIENLQIKRDMNQLEGKESVLNDLLRSIIHLIGIRGNFSREQLITMINSYVDTDFLSDSDKLGGSAEHLLESVQKFMKSNSGIDDDKQPTGKPGTYVAKLFVIKSIDNLVKFLGMV